MIDEMNASILYFFEESSEMVYSSSFFSVCDVVEGPFYFADIFLMHGSVVILGSECLYIESTVILPDKWLDVSERIQSICNVADDNVMHRECVICE